MTTKQLEALKERMPKEGFAFDEDTHSYFLDGKPLTGVTTILKVIAKPALIQWSADMACNYIKDHIVIGHYNLATKVGSIEFDDAFDNILKEARLAHRKKKERAGDWGTVVHKKIELWIGGREYTVDQVIEILAAEGKKVEPLTEDQKKMVDVVFNKFKIWSYDNQVKFIESEKKLFSKKHWYAGTCDLVFEMDGKRYIGDIKTSSGIYNDAFYQMGGYEIALEEMGYPKVDGYLVINLKKDGKMDLKMSEYREANKEAFLHALGLYKIINSLE